MSIFLNYTFSLVLRFINLDAWLSKLSILIVLADFVFINWLDFRVWSSCLFLFKWNLFYHAWLVLSLTVALITFLVLLLILHGVHLCWSNTWSISFTKASQLRDWYWPSPHYHWIALLHGWLCNGWSYIRYWETVTVVSYRNSPVIYRALMDNSIHLTGICVDPILRNHIICCAECANRISPLGSHHNCCWLWGWDERCMWNISLNAAWLLWYGVGERLVLRVLLVTSD